MGIPVLRLVIVFTLAIALSAMGRELNPSKVQEAEAAVREAIQQKKIPGAVVLVGSSTKTLYVKAFGNRAVQPDVKPMEMDTVFDLASLSKVVGCATSVMILWERGKIDVDEPVA